MLMNVENNGVVEPLSCHVCGVNKLR